MMEWAGGLRSDIVLIANESWRVVAALRWLNVLARLRERRDYERWLAHMERDPAVHEHAGPSFSLPVVAPVQALHEA